MPSLVRRRPQESPRSKPLPTFGTSSNHGICSRCHPSSHLKSCCQVVKGCPHRKLQGWYHLHHQHQPTRFHLSQRGFHHPGQLALHLFCLLLSVCHSKPLHNNSASPAPLLQGWSFHLGCHCRSLRQVSLHVSPFPITPTPERRHRPHLCSSLLAGPSTSV